MACLHAQRRHRGAEEASVRLSDDWSDLLRSPAASSQDALQKIPRFERRFLRVAVRAAVEVDVGSSPFDVSGERRPLAQCCLGVTADPRPPRPSAVILMKLSPMVRHVWRRDVAWSMSSDGESACACYPKQRCSWGQHTPGVTERMPAPSTLRWKGRGEGLLNERTASRTLCA